MRWPELELLRRVADRRETDEDRVEIAARLQLYLETAEKGLTLDDCFGLSVCPGGSPWWRREATGRRDAALRLLARRHHGGRPVARQAAEIRAGLLRYAATAWRFDRTKSEPPSNYLGTEREIQFDILRVHEIILSERQLQRILSAGEN
ncbi:hypothetical protein [Methylobacterium sp. Leaf118]|uniref:hypothetical protein n=1 Tax=Methylobacterium sp. Leaf118 TaxID=2876562 RepID=UPI001E3239CD|nr:hypothetical protein [Methylobacterium sp. Leaf118]